MRKLLLAFLILCVAAPSHAWFLKKKAAAGESSWTIEDDFSSNTAANYTATGQYQGTLTISGGIAKGSAWNYNFFYHNTTLGTADQTVQASCSYDGDGDDSGGVLFRVNASDNTGYLARLGVGNILIYKFTNSATSLVAAYDGSYDADGKTGATEYAIKVVTSGANITVSVDGSEVLTSTDASYTGNYAGIAIFRGNGNNDVHCDNFQAK